jgi:regulator of sirC expression with transglutaminase-like and TPR domain
MLRSTLSTLLLILGVASATRAAEPVSPLWVKELAAKVRPSIVVISFAGREGGSQGLGTGFVIDRAGLIATNLHVIGEARPISVTTADGKSLAVKAVHASDRALDLAILQVEAENLPALELGDASKVATGEPVLLMGNPQGLKHSVVSGVVSGTREIDSRQMIQLAVPVEPGNSGGPVIDMQGRVLGVVTMKAVVTENLAFAVAVSDLKTLQQRPNPVPMERWLTIGAIDRSQWEPLFGARWQQRAGRIVVDGVGPGFGGRSLLLSTSQPPELPYEAAVQVRLDDEAGAAGLVFHADGGDKHYGFYPSNGRLRLSRFDGPDVFSWQVLAERPSEHYRPGEWNHLKIRVERDRLQCFVNGQLVIESSDRGFVRGRVGLAKFRATAANFRRFAVAKELPVERPDASALAKFADQIDKLPPLAELSDDAVRGLSTQKIAQAALAGKAQELDERASDLRRLAADVRTSGITRELAALAGPDAAKIDLLRAALTIARLDEEELDVEAYVGHVERMAAEIKLKLARRSLGEVRSQAEPGNEGELKLARRSLGGVRSQAEPGNEVALPPQATDDQKLAALDEYLFRDNGFHGSRTDYYHRANSLLNRVIDDREGLPITLSVLYIELGLRLGLKIEGVGLPAHFVVRHVARDGQPELIDVFDGAKRLSREQAEQKILAMTGEPPRPDHFKAVSERQILQRILLNLISNAQNPKTGVDREALIRYESAMLAIDPTLVRDRGMRAVCRWETGRTAAAVADLQVLIDARPPDLNLDELKKMQEMFRTTKPSAH